MQILFEKLTKTKVLCTVNYFEPRSIWFQIEFKNLYRQLSTDFQSEDKKQTNYNKTRQDNTLQSKTKSPFQFFSPNNLNIMRNME